MLVETELLLNPPSKLLMTWVERSPFQALVTSIGVATCMGLVAAALLVLGSAWDERSANTVFALVLLWAFLLYVFPVFFAATVRNLTTIASLDPGIKAEMHVHIPPGKHSLYQLIAGTVLAIMIHSYFVTGAGSVPYMFTLISIVFNAIFIVFSFFTVDFMYRYWGLLVLSARRVNIDLLLIDRYNCYANPLIHTLGNTVALLCIVLLLPSISAPVYSDMYAPLQLIFVVVIVAVIVFWIWPLNVVHKRIRNAKLGELLLIEQALGGDQDALSRSIVGVDGPKNILDIIYYKEFVSRLWTWPVGAYLQRLLVFGILPPLSWVLSAFIETTLQNYL